MISDSELVNMNSEKGFPSPAAPAMEPRQQHPLANYQFSAEELRALRECNTESFFQRSLPLGTTFGLAAYFGVKRGFFSPNVRFGAAPKVVVSVIIGYFLGKFSYQQKCAEKIMRIPNSRLGELLKQRKRGSVYDTLTPDQGLGAGLALAPFSSPSQDLYSDEGIRTQKSNPLDLDTERPVPKGLDETLRPSVDSPITMYEDNLPPEPPKHSVTYEELRRRNREEYLKKTQNPYSRPLPPEAPVVIRTERPVEEEPTGSKGQKNRYGDVWSQ